MDTFPTQLAHELRAQAVHPLPAGGSPARVWRVETGRDVLAVKVLRRGAGIVDGHDIQSFLQEPTQLRRLHRELPALASYYVDVVGVWDRNADWAAYAMPYVDGVPAVAPGSPPERASARLAKIFRILTEHGYARTRPTGAAARRNDHQLGRVCRRLWVLEHHVDRELLDGPPVVVNGTRCRPLGPLVQVIESDRRLVDLLRPRLASYPVHGDLDLGNVLAARGNGDAFTLIDPLGAHTYRDPVQDFARALFSLTIYDRARASGLRIWRTPGSPDRPTRYDVRSADAWRQHPARATSFVRMLGELPFGAELTRADPHWPVRMAFSHAFHALADAACRLSDRASRRTQAGARHPVTLATGFVALGLRLLEQAIAAAHAAPDAVDGQFPDVSTGLDDDVAPAWRLRSRA